MSMTKKHWQLSADSTALSDIDDIQQCIFNILNTPLGSDVTRPDFGSAHLDYLDAPTDVLIPNVVREITLAINTWEKRAVIKNISFIGTAPHLSMNIAWQVAHDIQGEIYRTHMALT